MVSLRGKMAGLSADFSNFLKRYDLTLKNIFRKKRNNYLLLLIFSSFGFSILLRLIQEDRKNNLTFLIHFDILLFCL